MSVSGELRTDIVDVVRHTAQYRVRDRFGRIASRRTISMKFLDPLEIDDRHDTDLEIGILRHVHLVRDDRTMETFVEKEIRARRQWLPFRECAGRNAMKSRLVLVVDIITGLSRAALGVVPEVFSNSSNKFVCGLK